MPQKAASDTLPEAASMPATARRLNGSGADGSARAPAGWYPDPADASGATQRRWDGAAWRHETRPAPGAAEPLPHWKRRPFAILRHRWFHIFLVGLALGLAGLALSMVVDSSGPIAALSILTAVLTAAAYGVFLDGRIRLHEAIDTKTVVLVAVIGGALGYLVAYGLEGLVQGRAEDFLTGPIEEPAKLIVPLLLFWLGGERFRDPRAGLAIVLASAAGVGVIEDGQYIVSALADVPHAFGDGVDTLDEVAGSVGLARPLTDAFLHMSLTGIVGAVAWRIWWLRGGFRITWGVIGALVAACVLHSAFDAINSMQVELYLLVAIYMAFKLTARNDVPPNAIGEVPPWWRPRRFLGPDAG